MSKMKKPKLPAIGAPFEGGFYAGTFFGDDGAAYALVVAPKAEGESNLAFKTQRTADPLARSLRDGLANSNAINDDAHPAAKFCRGLRIGGFDDWYLPARHEAALLAETLMPGDGYVPEQTTADAFKEGGPEAFDRAWHWTSTEFSSGYAWVQNFSLGNQYVQLQELEPARARRPQMSTLTINPFPVPLCGAGPRQQTGDHP